MITIKSVLTQIEYRIFKVLEEFNILEYRDFLEIEKISTDLFYDLSKFVERDPAAKNYNYVLNSYNCFKAIIFYRVANNLFYFQTENRREKHFLETKARQISEDAKSQTGVEIHPAAKIAHGFVIDHGYGTVIGETAIIGENCYLLQGVILGAKGIANNHKNKRHPTLKNNVQIGAFAKILGNVTIEDNVFIGPNCTITKDILSNAKIVIYSQMQNIKQKHLSFKFDNGKLTKQQIFNKPLFSLDFIYTSPMARPLAY